MEASCWVARKIFLSFAIASSSARTLDSRPTTNGVIMYGKITTSRMGIIGRRLVSDFSFEVSMYFVSRGDSDAFRSLEIPLSPSSLYVRPLFYVGRTARGSDPAEKQGQKSLFY